MTDMPPWNNTENSMLSPLGETILRKPKKLIVCCDGTWMDSDSGWVDEHLQTPSNVTRIARAIKTEDSHSSPQIVYYQAGVGTGIGFANQILGGGIGLGLAEHIREAYAFLANNYGPGDLIYLIGFSRGAFTARSLGGLIGQLGLLNKRGLRHFYEIFEDWEQSGNVKADACPIFLKNYRDELTGNPYPDNILKTPANDPDRVVEYLREYRTLLRSLGLMHKAPPHGNPSQEITIQAVGCWDTVGALGIPINPTLQRWLKLPAFLRLKTLRWMDTTLTDNIVNAFQALALDEHRAPFSPAVWEKPQDCDTNLKQVWFPGAHSGVGGGYADTQTADISLAWMMDQLSGHSAKPQSSPDSGDWLEFDEDYLPYVHRLNNEWYKRHIPPRSWGNGTIFNSFSFPQSLAGHINRTPGRYRKVDKHTGEEKKGDLLRETNEFIHASARARLEVGGHAPVDNPTGLHIWSSLVGLVHWIFGRTGKALYQPKALDGWVLEDGHQSHDDIAVNNPKNMADRPPWWRWEGAGHDPLIEKGKRLSEDRLGKFELQLLYCFQDRVDRASPEDIEASNGGFGSVECLRRAHTLEMETRRAATL